MRLHEGSHLQDKARVVDAPEPPFGKCERLVRVRLVQPLGGSPLGLAADVVEIVTDDVDVLVARVVRLRAVPGDVRRAVALRVPDHLHQRCRVDREVAARERRQAEPPELCVHDDRRPAVDDQVDPRERFLEVGRRVSRLGAPGLCERAVRVPVAVHLAERANVHLLRPRRDRGVHRDEICVALARRDLRGRDRLPAERARAEAEHRNLAHRREQALEPRSPRCALSPADDRVADLRVLPRQRLEPVAVAEDAEGRARARGGNEHERAKGDKREPPHA